MTSSTSPTPEAEPRRRRRFAGPVAADGNVSDEIRVVKIRVRSVMNAIQSGRVSLDQDISGSASCPLLRAHEAARNTYRTGAVSLREG